MATSQATLSYLLDQLAGARTVRARKMFGEYALYCDEKVVALVCDDQLFVKITPAGREWVGDGYAEGIAYPGAKPSMLIAGDRFDDGEWLAELIRRTADALPAPKMKPKKKPKPPGAGTRSGKRRTRR
jgi:TfoX/Sxy family transcriptional regulator of competence genes